MFLQKCCPHRQTRQTNRATSPRSHDRPTHTHGHTHTQLTHIQLHDPTYIHISNLYATPSCTHIYTHTQKWSLRYPASQKIGFTRLSWCKEPLLLLTHNLYIYSVFIQCIFHNHNVVTYKQLSPNPISLQLNKCTK